MLMRSFRVGFAVKAAASALALALALAATPAEARRHHASHHAGAHHAAPHHAAPHHGGRHAGRPAVPGSATAAIVVDGATGRTIWGFNEDAPRHPASITKVMTLYLLFEQLEKGAVSLDDQIPISAHAAAQSPSKLGLNPGSSIRVEDAIKAIVTKSANDMAVAVAEFVGGTESDFAAEMTHKARAIGMEHTLYRNASGLPNNEQITTARDLAILGRNIQTRFPRYYRYFSLHEFAFRGQRIHTHNHLMDRLTGMDGIKTGYTAASGFNLLSSVKRGDHFVVAAVMGGKSAPSRDNYMEAIVEKYIDEAGPARAARVAETAEDEQPRAEARPAEAQPFRGAPANPVAQFFGGAAPAASADAGRLQIAAVNPDPRPRPAYVSAAAPADRNNSGDDDKNLATGSIPRRAVPAAATTTEARDAASTVTPASRLIAPANNRDALRAATRFQGGEPSAACAPKCGAKAADAAPVKTAARQEPKAESGVSREARQDSGRPAAAGWMIQVGATDDAAKAAELLTKAKAHRAAQLGSAKAFTEKVSSRGATVYRARFAGLEENEATAACKALKSSGLSCFATRN